MRRLAYPSPPRTKLAGGTRSFGSVRAEVRIGASTWRTSIFPDTKRRTFVLPVKKAIRNAEGVEAGSTVRVVLRIRATE